MPQSSALTCVESNSPSRLGSHHQPALRLAEAAATEAGVLPAFTAARTPGGPWHGPRGRIYLLIQMPKSRVAV
ncbi:hypothetical protein [Streptomyces caelestis]|uniref:hypothetical protein n=1 Tax=Streptomyces caelestis TaxID=36816 RepID=UPI0036644EB8